jgi:hypothetical protein
MKANGLATTLAALAQARPEKVAMRVAAAPPVDHRPAGFHPEVSSEAPAHGSEGNPVFVDGVDRFAHQAVSVNAVLAEEAGLDANVMRAVIEGAWAQKTCCSPTLRNSQHRKHTKGATCY